MRWSAEVQGQTVEVWLDLDAEGKAQAIRATVGKPGNALGLVLECVWRSASLCLAAGVPLSQVLKGLRGHKSSPSGPTTDPLAPECLSLVDYVARAVEARVQAMAPAPTSETATIAALVQ